MYDEKIPIPDFTRSEIPNYGSTYEWCAAENENVSENN